MSDENTPLDVIEILVNRIEVIESLMKAPKDEPELVAELDIARSTVDRALDELESLSLITHGDDDIEFSLYGRLIAEEYHRFEADVEGRCDGTDRRHVSASQLIEAVVQRAEIIASLGSDPREKRTLANDLDISRSTADRATWQLEEFDLIEYASGSLRLTETGQQINQKYGTFKERVEGLVAASELLVLFDVDVDIDPAALVGAEIVFPGEVAPFSTGDRLLELLSGATRMRNLSQAHVLPESPDLVSQKVLEDGMASETVFQADMLDYIESEYSKEMEEIAARENAMYFTIDSLPFALWLLERADGTHLCIQIYDDERQFGGLIINDSEEAIEWGERTYDRYLQRSERADQ